MKTFLVTTKMYCEEIKEVTANSEEEAVEKVKKGDGVLVSDEREFLEYQDSSTWTTEEI